MNAVDALSGIQKNCFQMLPEIFVSILLIFMALEDLFRKTVSYLPLLMLFLGGIIFRIRDPARGLRYFAGTGKASMSVLTIGAALLPGIMMILMSFITKEAIGLGDSLLLLILGIWMTLPQIFLLLTGGLICSFFVAMPLLILRRNRQATLPFIPCLFVSWAVGLFLS